jgi:hypothetical protein
MLLEFKSKEAALKAFSLSDINIAMFRNHVLFDGCEIHRHPGSDPFIIVFYSSGLEDCYVYRCVTLKHYDKYIRLIPQEEKFEWIAQELINLFKEEYRIVGI